jgi:hypothetical protein
MKIEIIIILSLRGVYDKKEKKELLQPLPSQQVLSEVQDFIYNGSNQQSERK